MDIPNTTLSPSTPDARAAGAAENAKAVLGGRAYRFCSDTHYPLTREEIAWCPLLGDKNASCPAMIEACKPGARAVVHEQETPSDPWTLRLPNLGGFGTLLFWTLIVAGAVALVYAIAKNAGGGKRRAPEREEDAGEPEELPSDAAKKALETDVERLLARARRAASEGRLLDATAAAHAALLRQLEGEHLIRVHPSSTNGDYVRELSPHPSLRSPVREIVRDVERLQFGQDAASLGMVDSVIERVTALVRSRGRGGFVGPLGAATMLLLVMALGSCRFPERGPWESSPSGNGAVIELLARSEFEPRLRFQSFAHLPEHDAQLVLLPGANLDPLTWEKLLDWARDGGTLVVTEEVKYLRERRGVEIVQDQAVGPEARVADPLRKTMGDLHVTVPGHGTLHPLGRRLGEPPCNASGSCDSDEDDDEDGETAWPVLVRGASTYAAEFSIKQGRLVVLADDRLFTNAALAVSDDAAFLVALFSRGGKRIGIAGERVGRASSSPLESIKRSNLRPVMLQLGAMLLLLFLSKGVAFGALRDPVERSRRSFADHVRALGVSYKKSNSARHASMLFATFALERLRERTRLGQGRGIAALADGISVRSGRPLGQVARILVQAEEARESGSLGEHPSGREEHLTLIRELSTLLRQVGGGSR